MIISPSENNPQPIIIIGHGIIKNRGLIDRASPYALRLVQLPDGTLKDLVSGKSPSYSFGGVRYDKVNSVQTAFSALEPVVTEKGIRCSGAYKNFFKASGLLTDPIWIKAYGSIVNSGSDVTNMNINTVDLSADFRSRVYQTTSSMTGNFSFYGKSTINGTFPYAYYDGIEYRKFYASLSAQWSRFNINFVNSSILGFSRKGNTNLETINIAIVAGVQLSEKKYPFPYIASSASQAFSTSESGTASGGSFTNGVALENVPSRFPVLNYALKNKGEFNFEFTPGYAKANVSGDLNLFSFDGLSNSVGYDATNGRITATDGANTAYCALAAVANTTYKCKVAWEKGNRLQVFVNSTAGTAVNDFDGFNVGTDTVFGLNNADLHYIKNPTVFRQPTWEAPV